MLRDALYLHTNLIAKYWRALAAFYCDVFSCRPAPPERSYSGRDLERGASGAGAALAGVHLLLPGFAEGGPTLEIFSYSPAAAGRAAHPQPNHFGFGHIAFAVASVSVGDTVTHTLADGRRVEWCCMRDPEGNLIELQLPPEPSTHR
ncbi:MAG: VOC family protein [Acidobacteria bacterium]|nr:VOC family protein [Acidobacteriota bacterium]